MVGLIAPGRSVQQRSAGMFGADPHRRAGAVRQPSLLELMSLTDWPRFVPETLGLLLAIVLLHSVIDAGSPGSSSLPHGFWIPVLLMAAQYGIMGGLFAAASASVLFVATDLPAQSAVQDFYEYATFAAAQPCAWFATSLALGGLRTLHRHRQVQLAEQLEDIKAAAEAFAESLTIATDEIALLEQRIAADTATIPVILDLLAAIDLSSRQTLLASFADLLRHAAGATSFIIYLREGEATVPCFGFEAGAPVPRAALSLLPQRRGELSLDRPDMGLVARETAAMPLSVPIKIKESGVALGLLVCTQLTPNLASELAQRRLSKACRMLAQLLVACPASIPSAHDV